VCCDGMGGAGKGAHLVPAWQRWALQIRADVEASVMVTIYMSPNGVRASMWGPKTRSEGHWDIARSLLPSEGVARGCIGPADG